MAEAKMTVELGITQNKQEFEQVSKSIENLLLTLNGKRNNASDNQITKSLNEQYKIIEKIALAYDQAFDNKTGQINISKLNEEMKKSNVTIQQFRQAAAQSGQAGAVAYNQFANSVLNANVQLRQSNQLLDKMATTFKNTVRYGISSSIFNSFTNSVRKAYEYTVQLDTSLNDIRIVSNQSAEQMNEFAVSANKAAQALGRTTLDYTKAATIYFQQGLSREEVEARTEATLKAANVTGQNAQDVSEQLTAVWNGYRVANDELELYVDKLAAVAAHSASNLEELSTGMSKVASAANVMGVDIDQLTAQMSTIISVTRQAPESVGTALRTIYARIADINAGMDEETTLGNYSGKMAKLGFNVLDANGKLKDMGAVIEEIGAKWTSLDREQQIALARTMAGTRQYNNLLTLFDNWDKYEDALDTATNAAGTLQRQQDIYMESTEAHLKQMQAEAEKTYSILFNQEAARGFIDTVTSGFSLINTYLDSMNKASLSLGGAWGQIATLGANIFSKQIASGISGHLQSKRVIAENQAQFTTQKDVLKNDYLTEDYSTNATLATENRFQNRNALAKASVGLSNDKYQEAVNQEKELFELQSRKGELLKQFKADYQEYVDLANKMQQTEGQVKELLAKEGDLTEEENEALKTRDALEQQFEESKKRIATYSDEDIDDARREDELTANLEKTIQIGDEQNRINTIVKGTTAVLGTWNNLQSGLNILTDENASSWEKLQGVIGVAISQGMLLLTSYSSLINLFPALAMQVGAYTQAELLELAVKKGLVKEGTKELTVEQAKLVVQQQGVLTLIKDTIAKAADTLATKLHIDKLWEELVAQNAVNISKGNFIALAFSAVVAVTALTAAIGMWIASLFKGKTQEEKLQEAIEETSKKMQEAKDAYKELKDTISNYQSAKDGIKNLTEGTVEFYDAIVKANEEAQKLIDKWGLLANQDYTIDKNGLIHIDEDVLKDRQFEEQQTVFKASAQNTQARLELQKYYADQQIKAFQEEINTNGKYKYEISFDQAKSILDDYYKISQETAQNTSDSVKAIGEMSEKVLTPWDYHNTQQETTNDITEAIKTYAPSYGNISAQSKALNNQLSDELIRAYGNQAQVDKYNNTSSRQKEIIQGYLSQQREAFQSYGSLEEYLGQGLHMTDPMHGGYKQGQELINNFLEKKYGYHYDTENDQWSKNGRFVDSDKIEELVDELGGYKDAVKAALTEEYVTGNYGTTTNLNKVLGYIDTAKAQASAAGLDETSQKYVAEAYSALMTGQKYNTNLLTNQEKSVVNSLTSSDSLLDWTNWIGLGPAQLEMGATEDRSVERKKADMEDYNATLKEQAELLETTSTALEFYGLAMANAGTLLNEYNEQSAETIANSYKFNKNYNDAVKVYQKNEDAIKDWTQAMEEGREVSYETADAMGEVAKSLQDMGLSLNADTIAGHLDLVNSLLSGTEEEARAAYEALYELAQLDILKNMFGDTSPEEQIEKFGHSYQQLVDEINNTSVGDPLAEEYEQSLRKMLEDTNYTVDQIKELSNQLGITIPVEYQVPENFGVKDVDFTTAATSVTHRYTGQMPNPAYDGTTNLDKTIDVDYAWVETTEEKHDSFKIPENTNFQVNKTKQTSAASANFSKTPSNSKSSKKSGSGSSAKPSKKDPNKDELDRYQLVNVQLKEISKQLSKLDKEKNKLLGGNLVKNLNTQIKLLNDQITVTEAKLKIAKQEQAEVAGKLSGYGIKFDSEGNIANYASIFKQEQAKLNAIYTAFNGMSKDAQEAYQDTVKAAEESWKTFKDSISKYDNLIGETIPSLQQDIQDAFDKQTEMYIQEFNAEIKVRLDMSSAERDWNEFKRKVIDGIKDDDILGMATAKLKDFYSYYNEAGTAEIQSLTKQLEGQLEELRKQDEEGSADWYRDNRVKAIEDLKDNYDKIRKSLEDIVALEEEMQQKLLDMLNEAQEKFDDQVGTFENINKQLEHNIQLINLLTDQNDYETLAQQYAAQTKNRKEELDFYTKQKEFWEMYLTTLEQGSKEWEVAKEKYNAAAEAWASALETTIQAARQEFENNINIIFKTINNQLTNNKGLDYLNEEWELLASNSDLVLDNINRMQKMQDLTKKYNDAINSTSNIKAQQTLAQLRDSELDSLKAMGQLSEKDLERAEKKLDIVKAQIALEDAQRNKSQMRLRRDSQGNYRYQFVADEDEINQAQQNLYSAYNELYNFDKSRYTETLKQAADAWEEYQEKMAEAALINDPEVRAQKEALIKEQYDEQIGVLHGQLQRTMQELNESTFAELNALYAENEDNYELMTLEQQAALNDFNAANQTAFDLVFGLYTENTEKFHDMAQDQIDVIQNQMIPQWTSGYQDLVDAITGEGGIEEVSNRLMDEMQTAVDDYNTSLEETEVVAGNTFETISNAENEVIQLTQDMLNGNDALINKYEELTNAVDDQYQMLKDLMGEYEDAANKAKEAAEDAYEYIMKAKEAEAKDYAENVDTGPTTGGTGRYEGTQNLDTTTVTPVAKTTPNPPFSATLPRGTALYNANGYQYPKGTQADRTVTVEAEANGRYRVWGSTFNPHTVYVDKNAVRYDTGGYTGAWGTEGRMAMLHEKELVLNKKDTANMLNAVEILRGITENISADVLGKIAGASSIGINGSMGNGVLDQNVHITATFPGVQSSIEIQDALNNLVNMAAQRAQVK